MSKKEYVALDSFDLSGLGRFHGGDEVDLPQVNIDELLKAGLIKEGKAKKKPEHANKAITAPENKSGVKPDTVQPINVGKQPEAKPAAQPDAKPATTKPAAGKAAAAARAVRAPRSTTAKKAS